ncbi:hypothetical protein [Asticcacaulis solisilvae]|uniref:hypothetical protein n=1 Tax=Asticcacaulis solisilvae TaxID=1217274 RepID=UPI003FD7446A
MAAAPVPEAPLAGSGVLFDGNDIKVRYTGFGDQARHPETLFVTFTPRQNDRPEGFGEAFFQKLSVNAIYVVSKWNHWWNTPEFETALLAVADFVATLRPPRLITYGSSMGGLGALLAAHYLDPTETLAVCPQYSMDTRIVPFEKRWKVYTANITFGPDLMASVPSKGKTYIFVDLLFDSDRRHLEMIRAVRGVTPIPVNFAGHDVAGRLNKYGILSSTLEAIVAAPLDQHHLIRTIRASRQASAHYWSMLGTRALNTGRIRLAKHAATFVIPAVGTVGNKAKSAEIFTFLSSFYANRGQPAKADYYTRQLQS